MAGTSSRASPTSRQPRRCSCVTSSRTRTSTRSTSRSSDRTWTQARAAAPPPGPVDLGDGDHPDHGCPAGMSLDPLGIVALEILNSITILVLLALGLALIFGMMRIVNLAQGEFFTAGAFTVLTAVRYAHLPLWAGMLLAPLVVGAIGIAIERLIIRRLYGRPLDVIVATWGVSLLAFGLGAGLAGAAGAIMAPIVGVVPTMGVLYIARAFITVVVGGPVVLLGTLSSASVLGFIEALISRFSLFKIGTGGHCAPPPCEISIGGSAFFGQIALLIFAIVLLRLLPQGLSGFWRERE